MSGDKKEGGRFHYQMQKKRGQEIDRVFLCSYFFFFFFFFWFFLVFVVGWDARGENSLFFKFFCSTISLPKQVMSHAQNVA